MYISALLIYPIKKWARIWTDISPKIDKQPINTWKDAQITNHQGNAKPYENATLHPRMHIIKKTIKCADVDVEKLEPSHAAGGDVK